MDLNKKSIVGSLSGTDEEIYDHLPYLLQDLWGLGGGTNKILELVERNLEAIVPSSMILDLCCGKGAAIISISKKYKCSGKGIDLFEPFINEARDITAKNKLQNLIDYEVMDIKEAVEIFGNYDIAIYGGDNESLGDEIESLKKISKCCREKGYVLYSTVVRSIEKLSQSIEKMGMQIIDQSIIERKEIKKINKKNHVLIKQRAQELIKIYPAKKKLFRDYVKSRELESYIIENNMYYVNLLLRELDRQIKSC